MKSKRENVDKAWAEMSPPRIYRASELEDFHKKIQRFGDEPRTLQDGSVAQKFRWDDLAVAFGAMRVVKGAMGMSHYLGIPDRYEVLLKLWDQYGDWRRKQDWIAEQRGEAYQQTASEGISN